MVGVDWALNHLGVNISENRMNNIPYPKNELTLHVTIKTVQSGSFLGTFLVGPSLAAVKGERDVESMKRWAEHCGKYGALIGLLAGPVMTYGVIKNASTDAVWDRCYRLRYNSGQVRVDRLCAVGAAAGCAAATYLGDSGTLGALVGMNGGMILAAILNSTLG